MSFLNCFSMKNYIVKIQSDWIWGGQGLGQLTPRGMRQHLNLGMKLRNRYIDSNGPFPGFLPPSYRSDRVILFLYRGSLKAAIFESFS